MRTVNPENQYKISIHKNGKYQYASTQPRVVDEETGKAHFVRVHWGVVDENLKFFPGLNYYYASIEERKKLIFPPDWDLSEIENLSGNRKPGRPAIETQDENRLYGDVWLMENIANQIGIKEDLIETFGGNVEMANDVLTIAMFMVSGSGTLNHLEAWQRITKTPSDPLSPPAITRLTQTISNQNRVDLFKMRRNRLGKDELCAVDSTSRSTYGNTLADIRWGKNKERIPLPQTTEVVVYSLSTHMPIYYRTFPGNMPDTRSLETILTELENCGFKNLTLITDRGYESIKNLEMFIDRGQNMIMGAKTAQALVSANIPTFSAIDDAPVGMKFNRKDKFFYAQHDIEYTIEGKRDNVKKAVKLKLNVYFNPLRQSHEKLQLQAQRYEQDDILNDYREKKIPIEDPEKFKKAFSLYRMSIDAKTHILKAYELDTEKFAQKIRYSGFFANITHGIDLDACAANDHYHLRDEQEKYFTKMKSNLRCNRIRVWSEMAKDGREFILFVAETLISAIAHTLKSTEDLAKKFSSVEGLLDEMRPIRYIEHPNTHPHITPFVGKQLDICAAFGFEVPEECAPEYMVRKTNKGKRGRPKTKKTVVTDN